MDIDFRRITIRELAKNYADNGDEGVVGYDGKLNIRPAYQREFIYGDKERDAVIDSVKKGLPLGFMYWAENEDGTYELLDGQQRTISICKYINREFSFKHQMFFNLSENEQDKILDYEVTIYVFKGSPDEKLEWFKTINIAGKPLTKQELRNAVYSGPFISDAKRYFSRQNGAAYNIAKDYVKGSPIRQDFLETALKWISKGNIEDYLAEHQHDPTAVKLWNYFRDVILWVEEIFPVKRAKFMKGVDWGALYDEFHDKKLDSDELEREISALIMDDDATKKSGIYPYVLTRDEKYLSIRAFSPAMKQKVYEKQKGICPSCGEHFSIDDMEADHIVPWSKGGKTDEDNCQMLCKTCNHSKGDNLWTVEKEVKAEAL